MHCKLTVVSTTLTFLAGKYSIFSVFLFPNTTPLSPKVTATPTWKPSLDKIIEQASLAS
jgi:hypothetical protein